MSLSVMLQQLASGMVVSVEIFVVTLLFSLPLGLLICFGRMSKNPAIRGIVSAYISVMRGTPLMLQLMVVYFGPYFIFGIRISMGYSLIAVFIAFSINYAAYFAEIYRGGIESISAGQYEAAKILGYSKAQTFFRIILPQVIKRILPSVTNEVITLVKDTSLAFVVAVSEMFTIAKQIASAQLPGKKILEVFPFSNSARGNDQIICVANCMNDDQQVDANGTFMVLMHLKDINAMKYLTFTCDGNTNLRSHSIDVVDKQRIGETTYIILCYRNFSYGAECRDCVERVYAIYNPDNMTLHKVVYSGKDSFAPDGTLHRIEGEWLPMEDNTYTQWLKNYAEKQLKPYVK